MDLALFTLALLLALCAFLCLSVSLFLMLSFMLAFLWGFLKVEICKVMGLGQGEVFLAVRMKSREDLMGSAGRSSIRPGEGTESPSWLATVQYEKDNICLGECASQGWAESAHVAASHSGWSPVCRQLEGN